jgi:hypothetical protein
MKGVLSVVEDVVAGVATGVVRLAGSPVGDVMAVPPPLGAVCMIATVVGFASHLSAFHFS